MVNCPHNPHDVVFYGVLNLNFKRKIVGSLDIWLCKKCRDLFFEEKRFIDVKPNTNLGFKGAGDGAKWGVLVCYNDKDVNWAVYSIKPEQEIEHKCLVENAPPITADFGWEVSRQANNVLHKIILLEKNVNNAVEITE
ncbi:MAG: hypothetical protein FJ358_01205 [Thaumarchaeota archaeon]|nr:hypothetical protein [Nitrososphaerota archaeon]